VVLAKDQELEQAMSCCEQKERAAVQACPTPEYHDTHRYCPSCPFENCAPLPPTVGRIVHYVSKMGDGVISPAVVLRTRQSTVPGVIERWGSELPSQYLVVETWIGVVHLVHVRKGEQRQRRAVASYELKLVDAADSIVQLIVGGGDPALRGLGLYVDVAGQGQAMLDLLAPIGAKALPTVKAQCRCANPKHHAGSVSGSSRPASLVAELPDDTTVDLLVHGLGGDYREYAVPFSCKGDPRSWAWPPRA